MRSHALPDSETRGRGSAATLAKQVKQARLLLPTASLQVAAARVSTSALRFGDGSIALEEAASEEREERVDENVTEGEAWTWTSLDASEDTSVYTTVSPLRQALCAQLLCLLMRAPGTTAVRAVLPAHLLPCHPTPPTHQPTHPLPRHTHGHSLAAS